MISAILKKLSPSLQDEATISEIDDLSYHNPFSKYFVWDVYDPDSKRYHNNDGSTGFVFECAPICFSAEKTLQVAEAIMRLPLPQLSCAQVLMHADRNIKPFIDRYMKMREGCEPIILEASQRYADFLYRCTEGIEQLGGVPLRNFRIIVSLKIPKTKTKVNYDEIRTSVSEILKSMSLWPEVMEPEDLLEWSRRLFNDNVSEQVAPTGVPLARHYNPSSPIGKQVLYGETDIVNGFDHLRIGNKYFCCLTPKMFPSDVDPLQTNELFGGVWGVRSDGSQINAPFMYALNIIFDDLKHHLRTKCDLVLQQGAVGSFARSLQRKQIEYTWAIDKIDQQEVFARVMPMMWVWHEDLDRAKEVRTRVKYVWEGAGYTMQEDKAIIPALLLSSLPMGFRSTRNNINMLERDIIASSDAIMNVLPIQADFAGSNETNIMLMGRKGQVCPLSIFSKRVNNYNGFIAASSGAGKSFFMNMLAFSQYSTGTLLRIVDLGGSYKKLCNMFNGRYLDFDQGAQICMNPFTGIRDPDEDLPNIASIIMGMVYSASDEPHIDEEEYTLAKEAVQWTYTLYGEKGNVDNVYEYLRTYPVHIEDGGSYTESIVQLAHHMAFNMREFTSFGKYGRYFVGDANFDIKSDKFLVLELDALRAKKDLFKVVTLLVLDAVTRDLYLSDRSQRRMVIFDEAWQFLDGKNRMLQDIIESGYRRARKYHGSFFIITQSLLDRKKFGDIGDIIWNNADYKFLLESEDFEKALQDKLITYDPFVMEILKTVKTNKPRYSEVFVDTPFGQGVARLSVDPFSYYIYTSDAAENSEMEQLVNSGMTWNETIHEMIRRYRNH